MINERFGNIWKLLKLTTVFSIGIISWQSFGEPDDLNPVKLNPAPQHQPVPLIENGKPLATICVMDVPASGQFSTALKELEACLSEASGAKLPVVKGKIVDGPAIVIGACPEAAAIGLDGKAMPVEGFAIKTAKDKVFIVGHDDMKLGSPGTAWGVLEFLERVLGVRWYWPTEHGGRSVPKMQSLAVSPLFISDAPVFRKREIWPANFAGGSALHTCLRAGNSWPVNLVVHAPHNWGKLEDYSKNRPEVFQKRKDGSRDDRMLCYGNKRTLETYLELLSRVFDKGEKLDANYIGVSGNAITVSPWDADVVCYCDDCRRLWDEKAGSYGTASRIMGEFVVKLAKEVKKRWPDKLIIFLPYLNYTFAPKGIVFPDNVEVQLCGMPGVAMYKEAAVYKTFQDNIDTWKNLTSRKLQTWDYSCWPEDKTKAPYQYPHVLKNYYQANKDKIVGTFINGVADHWPRQNISLYCWLKCLWNPDFNVDAAMDEFCKRMFGPAAGTMRELLQLQCDGWEKSRWTDGVLSAKGIYGLSFPRASLDRMKLLLEKARKEIGDDPVLRKRLAYYEAPFGDCFKEYEFIMEGKGLRVLNAKRGAENPAIDGKLDDPIWQTAEAVQFMKFDASAKTGVNPICPTQVKAVWSRDGITFGLIMNEPNPAAIRKDNGNRDDGTIWHQDCVEIFLDPSGTGQGAVYQFILTAGTGFFDAKGTDIAWTCEGLKYKSYVGADFWSLEVYIPLSAFPGALAPNTGVSWNGQFTRHRMADGKPDENQKMNALQGGFNSNTGDFAPIKFIE